MTVDLSNLPENISVAAATLAQRIDFETINEKGANGWVLIGRNKLLDRKVVVKFYYWGGGAHMEPRLLSMLASPHVLEVDDAAAVDSQDAYFIAPFCDAGDLDDVLAKGQVSVKKAVSMISDIATGTNFIHTQGYIHRDLKPSNIFCDDAGKLVIGDFGSVVKKGDEGYAETASRHSLLYRTPEEIQTGRAYPQGDIYQLGIILFQLVGGHLPYEEQAWLNEKELIEYRKHQEPDDQIYAAKIIEQRIIKGKLLDYSSIPAWCPPELIALIKKCCKTTPSQRINSPATLLAKLHNVRPKLADWRFEPEPILYRGTARLKIVAVGSKFTLVKKANAGSDWRNVRSVAPCSLKQAVAAALAA